MVGAEGKIWDPRSLENGLPELFSIITIDPNLHNYVTKTASFWHKQVCFVYEKNMHTKLRPLFQIANKKQRTMIALIREQTKFRKCGKEDTQEKCVRDAESFWKCGKITVNAGNLEGLYVGMPHVDI